jgi:hypothetical protein
VNLKRPLLRRPKIRQQPFAHLPHAGQLPPQSLLEAHLREVVGVQNVEVRSIPACRDIIQPPVWTASFLKNLFFL